MTRDDLEKLVRDVRSISERLPHAINISSTERRHIAEKMRILADVGQRVVENTLQLGE